MHLDHAVHAKHCIHILLQCLMCHVYVDIMTHKLDPLTFGGSAHATVHEALCRLEYDQELPRL